MACAGLLQRASAGRPQTEGALMALAVAAQPRLLAALAPPPGTAAQPLTLAMLQAHRWGALCNFMFGV